MAVEIDPLTGKPKKTTVNFPYPQPGQNLPMVPAAIQQPKPIAPQPQVQQNVAPQPASSTTQGAANVFDPNQSKQVISAAQNKALQGTPQATAGMVSQQTQGLLKDPSMGVDYAAQRKTALDQLARKQATDFEAMRQATGGQANLGFNIESLLGAQLQQRQEKTDTQRQLEYDEQNRRQSDMLKALAQGKETVGMEQGLQTGDIQNLISSAGGALGFAELGAKGEMQKSDQEFTATQNDFNRILQRDLANLDVAAQKEMLNLKSIIDKDMLMTQQDFQSTENELTRQFQDAMQTKDYAQANKMALLLNDLDLIKMEKANEYDTAKMNAMNAFQEGLVLSEQDFAKSMEFVKYEIDKAMMDKDTDRQKVLMEKQNELELQKMTQNFNHDEKMAVLGSELEDARANNDVERQKTLLTFSNTLEMKRIEQEQGFQQSMVYLDAEMKKALQNNDFENAKVLNQMQYDQQMKMHLDEMGIEQAKIDLQQQGIDMQKIESEYQKIQDQIKAGVLDPSDGVEYLSTVFKDSLPEGFEFTTADPLAVQKALTQDYLNQQLQYALSLGTDENGNATGGIYDVIQKADGTTDLKFVGLNDELMDGFSKYLNSTVYLSEDKPFNADIIAYKTGEKSWDTIASDPQAYDYLLKDVGTVIPNKTSSKSLNNLSFDDAEQGSGASRRAYFPQLESSKFVNNNGELFAVESWNNKNRLGHDDTIYILRNVKDGSMVTVTAEGYKF